MGSEPSGATPSIVIPAGPKGDKQNDGFAHLGDRNRGGHQVPEATVGQRYQRSVRNFFRLDRLVASRWRVYDNSTEGEPRPIAEGQTGAEIAYLP